jgi:hypothetical protein
MRVWPEMSRGGDWSRGSVPLPWAEDAGAAPSLGGDGGGCPRRRCNVGLPHFPILAPYYIHHSCSTPSPLQSTTTKSKRGSISTARRLSPNSTSLSSGPAPPLCGWRPHRSNALHCLCQPGMAASLFGHAAMFHLTPPILC